MNPRSNSQIIDQLRADNEKLVKALQFYSDHRRYDGPNQTPIANDPYSRSDMVYIYDVTRDQGAIARTALASIERKS